MHDPIGGFERIRDFFISYLETAFRIKNAGVSKERRALLERPGALCTEPLIEPIAKYERVNFLLHDLSMPKVSDNRLPDFTKESRSAFVDIVLSGLFDSTELSVGNIFPRKALYHIYKHQHEMLLRGIASGAPGIVTSGTGSGKTESFLLPIMAMLTKEGLAWKAPSASYLKNRWWQQPDGTPHEKYTDLANRPLSSNRDASPFRTQRDGEHPSRPKAVRALILYPMNALVEDQMVRIRRALDSELARAAMDRHLKGNRIFFAKYTGETRVTGFHKHPRPGENEYQKRARRLQELFDFSKNLQLTQEAASQFDIGKEEDQKIRYLFPTLNGGELSCRWDIQETPPDILITNVSMLNAILVREVDAPILDKTRAWLEQNEEAYFFLVLDELHLQRGSAGTEVSYLLRLLFERLGLSAPQHRHKLRILSSSASLPMDGSERRDSLDYLWDMFGSNGTWKGRGQENPNPAKIWEESVVPGKPITASPVGKHMLMPDPFVKHLSESRKTPFDVAALESPHSREGDWISLYAALMNRQPSSELNLGDIVNACVRESALRLASACWDAGEKRPRATELSVMAERLFGAKSAKELAALHGLTLVRGAGDFLGKWWQGRTWESLIESEPPSFRVHTFFRSIEGLFAAVDMNGLATVEESFRDPERLIGPLTIERGTRFSPSDGGGIGNRVFEMLYCECCGDLFFGGQRGGRDNDSLELLPSEPDVEGLPDKASRQLFEDTTAENYAVLWPVKNNKWPETDPVSDCGRWIRSLFDPVTGVAERLRPGAHSDRDKIRVYRYFRTPGALDDHERDDTSPGSSVPYECPSCGTDYSRRQSPHRLSPIRNFRTGFAKTTQLLATDLFSLLRIDDGEAKLVSFSDSRQDAAKAALDIEFRHHEDLRREILIETLRSIASRRPEKSVLLAKLEELKADMITAAQAGDFSKVSDINTELVKITALLATCSRDDIPFSDVLEPTESIDYLGIISSGRRRLKPLIANFVKLGIHPVSPTGVKKVEGGDRKFEWSVLFEQKGALVDWRDGTATEQFSINSARGAIVREMHRLMSEVIFSKTYFAMEETGLGYPCVPATVGARVLSDGERRSLSAFIRVFGDAYRTQESPWENPNETDPRRIRPPWRTASDIRKTNRIRMFTSAHHPLDEVDKVLDEVLTAFTNIGHRDGFISLNCLSVKLVGPNDPYWRCIKCGRIHLHRGVGICTRCYTNLSEFQTGTTDEIRAYHYIAKRIERLGDSFRLRCEELTGQTEDPADRQRRFKGLVDVGKSGAQPLEGFQRNALLIDMLAVTTTMEVGIDIGPLKSVFQANMPPQRFNYQQRVGRAGRRKMAFSMAVTVCRSKSHDLHYFGLPTAITGDSPPPPFLTKQQPNSALRFVRKAWLCHAFELLRQEAGAGYPGDLLNPPDIHGEFVPAEIYFDESTGWSARLKEKLRATLDFKTRALSSIVSDSSLNNNSKLVGYGVEDLMHDIDKVRSSDTREPGLANRLAEHGFFPMYGMPTRVRNLYLGLKEESSRDWSYIDRDLDIAIYEFAPGSVIVKDKKHHECIGFTGPLGENLHPHISDIEPLGDSFSAPFWMVLCAHCGSWRRIDDRPDTSTIDCKSCKHSIELNMAAECLTPNAYRTDFKPRVIDDEPPKPSTIHRSIKAEEAEVNLEIVSGTNLRYECQSQTRTYRLNRGHENTTELTGWSGFDLIRGTHRIGHRKIHKQFIVEHKTARVNLEPDSDETRKRHIWLAAPKTTDSLFLSPVSIPKGLWPHKVYGSSPEVTGVRAAAISATFILMNRAALELDIDPEEFDLIEPRIARPGGGGEVPVLHFTDHLVNGAGFCERLAKKDAASIPLIANILSSILRDGEKYPLNDFLKKEFHRERCDQACYQCLHRYRNQPYHGLLDWRLGLAYLSILNDPKYLCGIDGKFEGPALADWLIWCNKYADQMLHFVEPGKGEKRTAHGLVAFRLDRTIPVWGLVVHPLWDYESLEGILGKAYGELDTPQSHIEPVSSFDLSRRQIKIREKLLAEMRTRR